jgi:hypothetical protein
VDIMPAAISNDVKRKVLDQLVLAPKMKAAARHAGVPPATLFRWIKESMADPNAHKFSWLGKVAPFHVHVNAARKLSIIAMDHSARDLAINGFEEPRLHDGKPVYVHDHQVAADALTLDDFDWELKYANRKRDDTFMRDENGALIQDTIRHPPNPQVLVKLLTSLAPSIYGEKSEVSVTHQGSVWIEGGGSVPGARPEVSDAHNFDEAFALKTPADQVKRPDNTLALPRPCANSEEFDSRFRRKLLREVILFRDAEGKLLGPLPDDCVVAGTPQQRAFQDAGYEVNVVHPTTLLDEGYENDWLRALAPNYKRKPPKPDDRADRTNVDVGEPGHPQSSAPPQPKPGKASARWDSENLGAGTPPPGGRRVQL